MCWNFWGIFLSMELGILLGHGVLLFARFLRQRLYVSKSKYVYKSICGSPHLSRISPSKSCHGVVLLHMYIMEDDLVSSNMWVLRVCC